MSQATKSRVSRKIGVSVTLRSLNFFLPSVLAADLSVFLHSLIQINIFSERDECKPQGKSADKEKHEIDTDW